MTLLFRPLVVLFGLLPFLLSLARDWHRWLFFGEPRKLTPEQHHQRAQRLRRKIARLGPTFIKLAQLLGMREDFIPKIYAVELRKLQDQVPPFPLRQVKRIIRQEFNRPLQELFETFEEEPLAAASLGQVHRARYQGTEVAVKILRPRVRKIVYADLSILFFLIAMVRHFYDNQYLRNFATALREFSRMIEQEMDFRNELLNAERFRQIFADNPNVIIPEVYQELNTPRVFVSRFYQGIRVDDIEGLRKLDIDPMKLVSELTEIYTRQVVKHGFLHADPHPGNILITPEHRIVIVDYGMTVSFEEDVKMDLLRLAVATVRGDADTMVRMFSKLRLVDPDINPTTLRDACEILMSIQLEDDVNPRRIQQIIDDILRTFYRFPLRLPSNLVYLFRASALVEGIGLSFNPRFNSVKSGKPIVLGIFKEIYHEPRRPVLDRLVDRVFDMIDLMESTRKVVYTAEREELRMRAHPVDKIEMESFLATIMRRSLMGMLVMGVSVMATIIFLGTRNYFILIPAYLFSVLGMFFLIALPIKRRRRE